MWELWGSKFRLSHWKRTSLIQQLVATAQAVIWGVDHLGPISTKIGRVEGAHDVIFLSNFGFNSFRGFISTGGQTFHLPIDFAGHRYNSAATTVQPVMLLLQHKEEQRSLTWACYWEGISCKHLCVDIQWVVTHGLWLCYLLSKC